MLNVKLSTRTVLVLLYLLASVLIIGGCASTAPLPATLNIVPPAPNVPKEIAAFLGVWKGSWEVNLDSYLVVEKIDSETAEIIISIGDSGGYVITPQNQYKYVKAKVLPGPRIEYDIPGVNLWVFKMDKGLNKIYGEFQSFEPRNYGVKRIYMDRANLEKICKKVKCLK